MRSDSLSSDVAQSLSSIKNERKTPKRRKRHIRKKKPMITDTPESSQGSKSQSEEVTVKESQKSHESSSEEYDYEDSDFLKDPADVNNEPINFQTDFVTPNDIIKQRRLLQPYYTETAFDELFEDKGILGGDIIEICGRHAIGKTTLVTSLALNILERYPEAHVAFIDSKNDIQSDNLRRYLLMRGYNDEIIKNKFFPRILVFPVTTIFEFRDTLSTIIKGKDDYKKVSFIIIDSITCPFYNASGNIRHNMKMTSEIHELIFKLAKGLNKVIILTNLQLNLYKISASDDSGSDSSSSSDSSSFDESDEEEPKEIRPALGNYWGEILDFRILISMGMKTESDVLGFVEIKRKLTMLESRKTVTQNSVLVSITDTGVV